VWDDLWGWVNENLWAAWTIVAVLLAAAEVVSLDFVLIMLAVGAGAGAVTAAVSDSLALSLIVAIVVSVAMLGLVRPSAVKRLHHGPELTTGHDALVGRTGIVIATVDKRSGQIRLSGEVWTARSFDPGMTMDPGAEVEVFAIDGATAVVYPVD
jgi:membrane protein implicated in regulation of membrane protease activity